jgi:hypothetical protein
MMSATLKIIPEKVIKDSAKYLSDEDPDNSFIYALKTGKIYKKNNLSPMYILDCDTMTIYVTTEERMQNKFH